MEINEKGLSEPFLIEQPLRRQIKWDEVYYSLNASKKKKKDDDDDDFDNDKDDYYEEEEDDDNPFDIEPSEDDLVDDEFPDDGEGVDRKVH